MTNEVEKYGHYEFEIFEYPDHKYPDTKFYFYKIYTGEVDYVYDKWMRTDVLHESDEWFDTEQEARFAAIGHIDLLESGEG